MAASPAPGIGDVLRINPGNVTVESAVAMGVATVAGMLALHWSVRRSWPWLILAGCC